MDWAGDILSLGTLILVTTLVVLAKLYINQKWKVLERWNLPHDPPSILNLGNLISSMTNPFTYDLECKAKYGPIYGCYYILEPRIFIHDVEILRRVLKKDFPDFPNRDDMGYRIGGEVTTHGLLAANGDKWKRIRTTMGPAFSSAKLKQMSCIVEWCLDNTAAAFRRTIKENDGLFEAKEFFDRVSLDVICSTAFSTDVNSQGDTGHESAILKNSKKFVLHGYKSWMKYFSSQFPRLEPLFERFNGLEHVEYFTKLCEEIAERRKIKGCERVDLMQIMLDSEIQESELKSGKRRGLTRNEIIGNAITMLLAGYETTGTSMTYLAYNLATHPRIQQKLQAEIDAIRQVEGRLDYDSVSGLKYLDMCINESLRLYNPVWNTLRTAKNTVTVRGFTIPKGSVLRIPIYAMCHDPEFWEEPMEFRPERMKNMSEIDPMVFLTFGAGPRNCVGSKFAINEMKLAFCNILRHFSFEKTNETPAPPLKLALGVTTRPKDKLALRVTHRSATD